MQIFFKSLTVEHSLSLRSGNSKCLLAKQVSVASTEEFFETKLLWVRELNITVCYA